MEMCYDTRGHCAVSSAGAVADVVIAIVVADDDDDDDAKRWSNNMKDSSMSCVMQRSTFYITVYEYILSRVFSVHVILFNSPIERSMCVQVRSITIDRSLVQAWCWCL